MKRDRKRRRSKRESMAEFVLQVFDRVAASWTCTGFPGMPRTFVSPGMPNAFALRAMVDTGDNSELEHWPHGQMRKLLATFLVFCPAADLAFAVEKAHSEIEWLEEWERTSWIEYLTDAPARQLLPWHDEVEP